MVRIFIFLGSVISVLLLGLVFDFAAYALIEALNCSSTQQAPCLITEPRSQWPHQVGFTFIFAAALGWIAWLFSRPKLLISINIFVISILMS